MKNYVRPLLAAVLMASPVAAFAQGTITDNEEHLLRGFFDRQSYNVGYAKLALQQGSTDDVKKFAQSELDLYTKLDAEVAAKDQEFGLVTSPMKPGAPPPELSQGTSRGVYTLSPGVTPFRPSIGAVVAGTGNGAPGGAPPSGAPPGGAPPGGAAPGGAPGGAPGAGPSGPNPNAGTDDSAFLSKLSGKDFDKEYALRAIALHERMINFAINEINNPAANPDLVAFCKQVLVEINGQSNAALAIYTGETRRPRRQGAGGPGGGAPAG